MIGEVLPWATASRPGVTPHGSSVPFRVIDKAGQDWWAKSLTGRHGERATITDAIVGAVAPLISAPTCETSILRYPDDLAPHDITHDVQAGPGYVHGSRLIENVEESDEVMFISTDDNERRWVVNEPHPFEPLREVLATNPGHCAEYAQALRNVTTEELARALATIPAEWTVGTDELEHLGWFLSERLEPVANRIEQAGGLR